MNIFISYSSQNRPAVKALVSDLESLGHAVWFDQELAGGQAWWDEILNQIRMSDLVIFALTGKSIQSDPCEREYNYAYELGKPLLSVQLTDDVTISLLPVILQERNIVNYINQDKTALLRLNDALNNIPAAPPLPQPLPEPPEIPISPLAKLQSEVSQPDLSHDRQVFLYHQIKGYVDNPDLRQDALTLLGQLEKHPSLLASVFKEINTYLSSVQPDRSAPPTPPSLPAPGLPMPAYGAPPPQNVSPVQPTAGPATDAALVRVFREWSVSGSLRGYQIYIDGVHVGEVRNNEETVFEVAPGRHSVYAQMDWVKSEPMEFWLEPGQMANFLAKWKMGILGGKLELEPSY